VESYYHCEISRGKVVFDAHRAWCNLLPSLCSLFPSSRFVCCVRSPAWILDSIEQLLLRNPFEVAKIFGIDAWQNLYTRVDALMGRTGLVGSTLCALQQAWHGPYGDRLVVLRYESLVSRPREAFEKLYDALGEEPFSHDFENVDYNEPEFDSRIGMPGLPRVTGPVRAIERRSSSECGRLEAGDVKPCASCA
jgi:sulfotransferase